MDDLTAREAIEFERPLRCSECSPYSFLRLVTIHWLKESQFWSYWTCPICQSIRVLLNEPLPLTKPHTLYTRWGSHKPRWHYPLINQDTAHVHFQAGINRKTNKLDIP